jgi:peptidoglycan/xylan/chitin deacetylase (PgdA/CDA1 family)
MSSMHSLSRRDFLKLGASSLFSLAWGNFQPVANQPHQQPVIYQGSTNFAQVALTYDDCYLVTMLHKLEEVLVLYPDVRITLFPVGEALLNNQSKDPGVWNRFYEQGHEIGYHSFDHTNPEVLSTEDVITDFDRWLNALREVLGLEPAVRFARPPYGITSASFLDMCDARHVVPTMWSTGWGGPTESVVNYTVPKIRSGDIVLLHTRPEDMETSRDAIPELEARGIRPVTMTRLYLDLLKEQNQSAGCGSGPIPSLTRTCID